VVGYALGMSANPDISYFARTNHHLPHRPFGIKQKDRLFHVYAIGRTGTGKSTFLESLVVQDFRLDRGVCVIDPHGDLIDRLVKAVPERRRPELIHLDVADPKNPYTYNPLRKVSPERIPLAASGLLEAFKKLWQREWGVRMEHVLRNGLYALIEKGDASLAHLLRLISDESYRAGVVRCIENVQVRAFWQEEFARYNPRYRQEAIAPIQNKVGAFLADPRLRKIFSGEGKEIRLRRIMDEGKILLVNLSKGVVGEDSASLLGAILVTAVGLAALSRSEIRQELRRPFYVYIDEFQSFTTLSVATMISEIRKYRVGLTLAHQHLYQLEEDVRHTVLGNVGTIVSFRVGPEDARVIAREFEPVFSPLDLVNLPNWNVYVKLMIDGVPARPFSATTFSPQDEVIRGL
jgi:DNA helicase HerA-like ATPase